MKPNSKTIFIASAILAISLKAFAATAGIVATPLAKKSGTADSMTFTLIPASESGLSVENPYDDPEMWGSRNTEFQEGSIGTGVAVGDIDGDGLADVYVVNKTRPNRLFRQIAPFRFEDISSTADVPGGETWGTGATMADVDNDGDLDIYVCQFNSANLLYLNNGKGVFTEAGADRGLDLVSGSVTGAFEDYDRDGDLDVFVVTNLLNAIKNPEGEPDYLFENDGKGYFTEITGKAGIKQESGRGHAGTWTDFNEDGWPDLYVSNDFAVPDRMYRNNGDGTFTDILEMSVPHIAWFAMGSDAADINNDGMFDLLVTEMAFTTHLKSKVAMGDMGGLVDYMDTLVTPQYMSNHLFLNTGTDRFREAARLSGISSSNWSWSPRFEDLDNDGWLDLHITNGMVRNFINSDLQNTIKRVQSREEAIALMRNSPPLLETNLTFRNEHGEHFTRVQAEWGLGHEGVSFGSAFADFDGDGDLDIIYTNYDAAPSLYRNDSPAGNRIVIELRGTHGNTHGIGAVAKAHTGHGLQTRRLTVARGVLSSSQPVLHFGLGHDKSVDVLEIAWPSGHVQKLKNLAANMRYVIIEPDGEATPQVAVMHRTPGNGLLSNRAEKHGIDFSNKERVFNDMVRQSLLPNRMNTLGAGVARADVDGDGHSDIFFAGSAGQKSALYLNDGHGRYRASTQAQPWEDEADVEHMAPLLIDIDGDGDSDLLLTSGSVEVDAGDDIYQDKLFLNDGRGTFTEASDSAMPLNNVSSSVVAASDYDRDGDLDLFIGGRVVPGAYPTTPDSFLLENRNGTFHDVTDSVAPGLRTAGMVTGAVWSDADNDGAIDLMVTGEWMPLRFYRNADGKLVDTTEAAGLVSKTGWWHSLAAADIDQDGDIDYLAGNMGHNTKYHANADHPVRVFYADWEDDGSCEIVEAKYVGDTLYPVRGRSCSSRAMPSIAEKFPTFQEFGSAVFEAIYEEEKIKSALHVQVTELASGVFINDGKGHFTFEEFPHIAQVAPVFGIAAADFNEDGTLDVFLGQNFRGPQVETGRFDGGISQLLIGDGKGNFTPATAQESGVSIAGEVRGVALGDADENGRPDVLLTVINERSMLLGTDISEKGSSFSVSLAGEIGNATAVGARVTAHFASGRTQVGEIYAGNGYLSQSEATVFFSHVADDAPTSIDVRWPDGKQSTLRVKSSQARILIPRDS